jgi:hypothetical protein
MEVHQVAVRVTHPPIVASNVEHLRALYVATMRGSAGAAAAHCSGATLGPLLHLIVNDGGWRPEWLLRVHNALVIALDAFQDTNHHFYKGKTISDVVATLRRDFGLDRYPTERHSGHTVDERTRRAWRDLFAADDTVRGKLTFIVDRTVRACDLDCLHRVLVPWTGFSLTPGAFWVSDDEDTALLQEACKTLAQQPRDEVTDHLIRASLRAAVEVQLRAYFSEMNKESSNIVRHLHKTLLPRWHAQATYPLGGDITGAADGPTGSHDGQKIAAAAIRLFAWAVAANYGNRNDLATAYKALDARSNVAEFYPHLAGGVINGESPFIVARYPGINGTLSFEPLRNELAISEPADRLLRGDVATTPADMLERSLEIRQITDHDLKRRLIDQYIIDRVDGAGQLLRRRPGIGDPRSIDIADHGVDWDCVRSEFHDSGRAMAEVIERYGNRTNVGAGIRAHRYRSLAIRANKRNATFEADYFVHRGLSELLAAEGLGDIEFRESANQLALAGAGVQTRWLEYLLRHVPPRSPTAAADAGVVGVLNFAGYAYTQLCALAKDELPGTIQEARREHRLASNSWHIQTRIIRIRAALAARTAINAGLCSKGLLDTRTDIERELVSRDGLELAFRELICRDELQPDNMLDVVRLALWMAFLHGMEIPLCPDVAPAYVSARDILDDDPYGMSPWNDHRFIDPYEASRWLTTYGEGHDAGWLSQSGSGTAAAIYLDKTSGNRYRQWLKRDRERCALHYIPPSHD